MKEVCDVEVYDVEIRGGPSRSFKGEQLRVTMLRTSASTGLKMWCVRSGRSIIWRSGVGLA